MDSAELALCGRFFSLAHPTGYPLLTALLRLFSLIPVFALPFRLNLVSALAAAGSCLFVCLSVRRLLSRRLPAVFASLAWGLSFELWSQATALEVYALQSLLLSAMLYALVCWQESGDDRFLLCTAGVFGLALANHLTIVLWAPTALLLLFSRPLRDTRPRTWALAALLFAVGPLLYLLVPVLARPGPAQGWGGIASFSDFVRFVTARTYSYRLLAGASGYLGTQLSALPALFGKQFLIIWVLVVPGVIWCLARNRRLLLALALGFVLTLGFTLAYNIPDKEGYLLPAYLTCAVLIGLGFDWLSQRSRILRWLPFAGLVLPLVLWYPGLDRSRLRGLADLSESVTKELPAGAVLFTDDYSAFQGMRWVLADSPAGRLTVVSEHHLAFPWYLGQLESRLPVPDRAVALSRELWSSGVRGAEFGELAKARVEEIKLLLVRSWIGTHDVYWLPRDFQSWPDSWNEYFLHLHGLSYQYSTAPDTSGHLAAKTFPGTNRYRVTRFRDAETQNLCRRFAATVNRRGIRRFARDDAAGALGDFNLALEYFPDYPSAVENKGILFFFSRQPDSSRRYLQRFLELEPGSPETAKVRQFLNQLGH